MMRVKWVNIAQRSEDVFRYIRARFDALYDRVLAANRGLPRQQERQALPKPKQPTRPTFAPEGEVIYAVGDIHGRADLLSRLFEVIEQDISMVAEDLTARVVFLGDYVDRGFQSREVIEFLLSDRVRRLNPVFLKGNHEEAFVKFLNEPAFGPRWAEFGGAETLTSYGIQPPRARTQPEEWRTVCDTLNQSLPRDHRAFFHSLQLSVTFGDYHFVHAGVRPGRPLSQQTEQDMLWIRDEFLRDQSGFDAVIVHGHTPIAEPYRDFRRISIDTGAYLSGRLSAARFLKDEVAFFTT